MIEQFSAGIFVVIVVVKGRAVGRYMMSGHQQYYQKYMYCILDFKIPALHDTFVVLTDDLGHSCSGGRHGVLQRGLELADWRAGAR